MDGFYGRFLKIDLAEKRCDIEKINDELLIKYLGGKGLASYLLYTINPKDVDPLSPANC